MYFKNQWDQSIKDYKLKGRDDEEKTIKEMQCEARVQRLKKIVTPVKNDAIIVAPVSSSSSMVLSNLVDLTKTKRF